MLVHELVTKNFIRNVSQESTFMVKFSSNASKKYLNFTLNIFLKTFEKIYFVSFLTWIKFSATPGILTHSMSAQFQFKSGFLIRLYFHFKCKFRIVDNKFLSL
jgi:hypothetical protein